MIADREHRMRMRPLTRVALFAVGLFALLALAVSPLLHPATARAYDSQYYEFCTQNMGQDSDTCCTNAGGELSNGACYDPAFLHPLVTAVPTVTQQILPPVVVAPPP